MAGAIEVHDVACRHKDMTLAGSIAGRGPIVAARLQELNP